MLYRIGTAREVASLPCALPQSVRAELLRCTAALDRAYGSGRDWLKVGGYSLVAETAEDVASVRAILDLDRHPSEWVNRLDSYAAALYLLNDDFSITLFVPLSVAPKTILDEMEET